MTKTVPRPKCPHCGTRQGYDEARQVKRTSGSVTTFTACRDCNQTIVWGVQVSPPGPPSWGK